MVALKVLNCLGFSGERKNRQTSRRDAHPEATGRTPHAEFVRSKKIGQIIPATTFIIDVFARMIVGRRVSTSMTTNFMLDALNQAIGNPRPARGCLIHHSDRDMQHPSIRCAGRLAEADIDMSGGSVGDSCDEAHAESVIGLFKTEVVKHLGPRETVGQVEWETLKLVHCCSNERMCGAIGCKTPNEKEDAFRNQQHIELEKAA